MISLQRYAGGAEAGVGGVFVPAGGAEGAVAGGVDAGGVQAVEGGVLSQSAQSSDTEGTEVGGGSLLRVEGSGIGRKEAQEAQKTEERIFFTAETRSRRGDGVLSQSAQNSDTEHGDRIFLTAKGAKGREG